MNPTDDADLVEPVIATTALPSPPPGCRVLVERFDDGLTLNVPPAGITGAGGLLIFALIWNAAVMGFTVLMVSVMADQPKRDGAAWLLPLLLGVFWLVGIGILLGSLNMARRRAAIAVTSGTLMVIQTGIFGSKQRTWEPGDVEAVRVGPSGMTVNDKPVIELQIIDGGASSFGMLAGRKDEELKWMAAELRRALKVPTHAS
jgi:hypothetical protein